MSWGDKYHQGVPADHWHKFHDPRIAEMARVARVLDAKMTAIGHVQSQPGSTYSNFTITLNGVARGNFLTLQYATTETLGVACTISTIADSATSTASPQIWIKAVSESAGANTDSEIWYLPAAASGTHTLTVSTASGTTGTSTYTMDEWSNVLSFAPTPEHTQVGTNTSTNSPAPSIAPSADGCLVITTASNSTSGSNVTSPGGAWNAFTTSGTTNGLGLWQVQGSAAAISATMTGTSGTWNQCIASFLPITGWNPFGPEVIGSVTGGSAGVPSLSIVAPTAGHNAILANVVRNNGSTPSITAVSGGGYTWTQINSQGESAHDHIYEDLWLGTNSSGSGTTITITNSGATSFVYAVAIYQEFSGGSTSTTADVTSVGNVTSNAGSPNLATVPNITPTQAGDLFVSIAFDSALGDPTVLPSGWTGTVPSGVNWFGGFAFLIAGPTDSAAKSPVWTVAGTSSLVVYYLSAAFKVAPAVVVVAAPVQVFHPSNIAVMRASNL